MNAARHHLSPAQRHSRRLGHRRQRAGDGVRQHGRDQRDRRRLHPQSLDGREGALRRVPRQRAGRGRRGRHPHAAEHHRGRAQGRGLRPALARSDHAGGVQAVRRDDATAGEALQGHAGPRVHRRARQALDAADPQRQAHRRAPRCGSRSRWPTKGSSPREEAIARVEPATLDQLLHPTIDPNAKRDADRDRPARLARRRERRDRVLRRRGRGAEAGGPQDHPRARRDLARGHPRHARRRGHRHHARRHDQSRRGRGARHGQALRLRRRARSASTMPQQTADRRRRRR